MSDVKPKVGEWWICNLVSVMGNGDCRSAYKMTPALIVACNVLPIERLYTQKDNDRMVEEIEELREMLGKHKQFNEDMHSMDARWAIDMSVVLHRQTCELLNKND